MKRIAVYLRTGEIGPAGYYRILQYTNQLKGVDIQIRQLLPNWIYRHYHNLDKNTILFSFVKVCLYLYMILSIHLSLLKDVFWKPQVVIVSRSLIPRAAPWGVFFLIKKILSDATLIWDFDDHILESKEIPVKMFDFLCRESNHIVVTHEYLQKIIQIKDRTKVILLPTTDGDMRNLFTTNVNNRRKDLFNKEIQMAWVATSGNLPHLEKIVPELEEAASQLRKLNKKLIINVVCNLPIKVKTEFLIVKNIKWSRDSAINSMKNSHIGLMPLSDSTFSKGKGGFKLVQYMSIGLPILASNVGYNKKIVNKSCGRLIDETDGLKEWCTAILEITENWEKYNELSKGALNQWDKNYSYNTNYRIWKSLVS